jgi:hypothetical protein
LPELAKVNGPAVIRKSVERQPIPAGSQWLILLSDHKREIWHRRCHFSPLKRLWKRVASSAENPFPALLE